MDLNFLLEHSGIASTILVYAIWEFWLGKTKLIVPNSTIELVLIIVYKAIGKLLGKINPTLVLDAEKSLPCSDKTEETVPDRV